MNLVQVDLPLANLVAGSDRRSHEGRGQSNRSESPRQRRPGEHRPEASGAPRGCPQPYAPGDVLPNLGPQVAEIAAGGIPMAWSAPPAIEDIRADGSARLLAEQRAVLLPDPARALALL